MFLTESCFNEPVSEEHGGFHRAAAYREGDNSERTQDGILRCKFHSLKHAVKDLLLRVGLAPPRRIDTVPPQLREAVHGLQV